jgi:hypothetical protein
MMFKEAKWELAQSAENMCSKDRNRRQVLATANAGGCCPATTAILFQFIDVPTMVFLFTILQQIKWTYCEIPTNFW